MISLPHRSRRNNSPERRGRQVGGYLPALLGVLLLAAGCNGADPSETPTRAPTAVALSLIHIYLRQAGPAGRYRLLAFERLLRGQLELQRQRLSLIHISPEH